MKNKKQNKKLIKISKKAFKTIKSKIKEGGVTYSPVLNKDYAGTPNIAVSPFPERSWVIKGKVTTEMLREYCKQNIDLLVCYFALGVWTNLATLETYLDITVPIPLEREREAKALCKKSNQISCFNLSNFSEIPTGGTGRFNSKVASFENRLKTALALMN